MIRSILELYPRNGDYRAVVDYYHHEEILERAMTEGGCLSGELQVPTDGQGPLMVSCTWADAVAYQAWVDGRGDGTPDLVALLELPDGKVPPGRVYDVPLAV
jgi:hypothetical protein